MRNFILLFVAALFVGCASPGVQVTTDDEKSQAIKAAYDGYLVNDFTASNELYSDETAIYINSVETISNEENIAAFSSHHDFYTDISMSRTYIQTSAYDNDLGTWTHAWFVWKGTGKASEILMKFHVMLLISGVMMEKLFKLGSSVINPIT